MIWQDRLFSCTHIWFSAPDQEILELLNHAAYICHHGGTDALTIVEAKVITVVMSMVLDYQVMVDGNIIIPENRFSLVEVLFIRLAVLCGIMEDENDDIDDADAFVN